MEPDWWIELESTYHERIKQRKELFGRHGKLILNTLPGSEAACTELMEMVIQFICTRYPAQFQYCPKSGIFHNQILGLCVDTRAVHGLEFLLDHVPEDFLITQEDKETGLYILTGGIACSALGWNIAEKIGKPLHEIHDPVPDYKEKMQFSIDRCVIPSKDDPHPIFYSLRFFSKMPCDKPIQRGAWSLEIGQPLFAQIDDPHFNGRDTQREDVHLEDIHLRVDWQVLRRLPKSQAMAFNYKALFTPVTDLRQEPYIPKLLAKILRNGKPKYLEYKSTYHVEHRVLPALDLWAKEQEDKGWVPKDWTEKTLDEDPYYPGWERKMRGY